MKLVIFGATGGCGKEICRQALAAGHSVTAIVRNKHRLPDAIRNHEQLTIVEMETIEEDGLLEPLKGADAVLSGLGYMGLKMLPLSTMTFYQDTTKAIVGAMQKQNVKRLIIITSWCTESKDNNPKFMEWLVKPLFIGRHMRDMAETEHWLAGEGEGGVEFTCVRPPQLVDGPQTERPLKTAPGEQWVADYDRAVGSKTARADVARFMLECLDKQLFVHQCVAISY